MTSTTGFQLAHPHRPERVVAARSTIDIVNAVTTAAASESPLIAVQSTGHGRVRSLSGGTLIDTSSLDHVTVDPDAHTVTVGAGATFSAVIAAAAEHDLAPLSGSFPGVGVVGYCLSGGFGLLSRRYGFAADAVTELELVTADGVLRTVSPRENPELFWGMRGAGSNFGVVTSLTMRLFPIAELVAGAITIDQASYPQALALWRDWAEVQAADMMTAATLLSSPPEATDLPPFLRGTHSLRIQVCWSGDTETGYTAIGELESALHEAGAEFESAVTSLPFDRTGEIFAEPDTPHAYGSEAHFLSDVDGSALDRVLAASAPDRVPSLTVIGLRRLGGAMAAPPETPGALGHRDAQWLFSVLSPLHDGESSPLAHHEHILAELVGPGHESTRVLGRALNFTFRDLDSEAVASAYEPEDLDRLRHLRAAVDPAQMFMPQFPV